MDAYQQYRAWAEERLRQAQLATELQHGIVLLEMARTLFRKADDAPLCDVDWQPLDADCLRTGARCGIPSRAHPNAL